MRRNRACLLLWILGLLLGRCAAPAGEAGEVGASDRILTLCAAIEPPYVQHPRQARPGLVPEMLTAVAERAGVRLAWRYLPWSLAVQGVRDGVFDAVAGAPGPLGADLQALRPPLWTTTLRLYRAPDGGSAAPRGCLAGFPSLPGRPPASKVRLARGYAPVETLLHWLQSGRVGSIAVPAQSLEPARVALGMEEVSLAVEKAAEASVERLLLFGPEVPRQTVRRFGEELQRFRESPAYRRLLADYRLGGDAPVGDEDAAAEEASAGELTVLAEAYPPAILETEDGPSGFAVKVVEQIIARAHRGETPPARSVRVVNWTAGYRKLRGSGWVALFPTARTPQREKLFQWAGPLFTEEVGLYALAKRDLSIHVLEDARRVKRIGTVTDSYKETLLRQRGFSNLVGVSGQAAHARNLAEGWIDLWATSDLGMAYQARKAGVDPARIRLAYPIREATHYVAFSRNTPAAVVRAWQSALDDLRADGTFQRLKETWLSADAPAPHAPVPAPEPAAEAAENGRPSPAP